MIWQYQLATITFALIVLGMTILERRQVESYITPFSVCAWPFVFIFFIVNFLLFYLGFAPITLRVIYFILLNISLIWFIGIGSSFFMYGKQESIPVKSEENIFTQIARYDIYFIIISLIVIVVTLLRVYMLLKTHGGWSYYADEEFEETMIRGPESHLIQVGRACFILLFLTHKYSKVKFFNSLALLGLLVAIATTNVKYQLIFLVIMVFFYKMMQASPRKQLKNIVIILFLGLIYFKSLIRTLSPLLISLKPLEISANTSTVAEPIVITSNILTSF